MSTNAPISVSGKVKFVNDNFVQKLNKTLRTVTLYKKGSKKDPKTKFYNDISITATWWPDDNTGEFPWSVGKVQVGDCVTISGVLDMENFIKKDGSPGGKVVIGFPKLQIEGEADPFADAAGTETSVAEPAAPVEPIAEWEA